MNGRSIDVGKFLSRQPYIWYEILLPPGNLGGKLDEIDPHEAGGPAGWISKGKLIIRTVISGWGFGSADGFPNTGSGPARAGRFGPVETGSADV